VRVRIDMRTRVARADDHLADVSKASLVTLPPRFLASDPEAARGSVCNDVEPRVAAEERHTRKAWARERVDATIAYELKGAEDVLTHACLNRPARERGPVGGGRAYA
jgi:hypothetical protein